MKFIVEAPELEPKVPPKVLEDLFIKLNDARDLLETFKLNHCVKVVHATFRRSYPTGGDILDMKVAIEISQVGEFRSSEVIGVNYKTGVYERERDLLNLIVKLVENCLREARAKHAAALQQIPEMHPNLLEFSRQLRPTPCRSNF